MSRVLAVTSSSRLIEDVGYASPEPVQIISSPMPATLEGLAVLGVTQAPAVAILDVDASPDEAIALAAALTRGGVSVVLVTSEPEVVALPALRAGVQEVVDTQAGVPDLQESIHRAITSADARAALRAQQAAASTAAVRRGRIITVASPKGGVGKTTVSTNLAVGIAKRAPGQTVLVDLDIHFGDVASALNLEPEFTLPDTVRGPARNDPMALKAFLTQHETGLFVIPGSDNPAAADAVTSGDVSALLATLASAFEFVVVDTAPGLSEHTLAVLDLSSDLVLVTSLDVPGVRGLRKEIDTLRTLDMLLDARHVVLNFADHSRGLSVKDVEATIGEAVDVVIPSAPIIPQSVNQGIPLTQSAGRDAVTKQFVVLTDRVVPAPEAPVSRSLFGRRGK